METHISRHPENMEAHITRNPVVQTFYDSLSPKDKIIHDLAAKMLNTRYTPERSIAWKAWTVAKK